MKMIVGFHPYIFMKIFLKNLGKQNIVFQTFLSLRFSLLMHIYKKFLKNL